jgi:hypothetical protein
MSLNVQKKKLSTGIPEIDKSIFGGIKTKSLMLVTGNDTFGDPDYQLSSRITLVSLICQLFRSNDRDALTGLLHIGDSQEGDAADCYVSNLSSTDRDALRLAPLAPDFLKEVDAKYLDRILIHPDRFTNLSEILNLCRKKNVTDKVNIIAIDDSKHFGRSSLYASEYEQLKRLAIDTDSVVILPTGLLGSFSEQSVRNAFHSTALAHVDYVFGSFVGGREINGIIPAKFGVLMGNDGIHESVIDCDLNAKQVNLFYGRSSNEFCSHIKTRDIMMFRFPVTVCSDCGIKIL